MSICPSGRPMPASAQQQTDTVAGRSACCDVPIGGNHSTCLRTSQSSWQEQVRAQNTTSPYLPAHLTYLDAWELLAAPKVLHDAAQAVVAAMATLHTQPHRGRRLQQQQNSRTMIK